ncbi:MAG: hypothetical protein DELT_00376 [Desulfovibrio sp.]
MKRLVTLAFAAAMTLSLSAPAKALDVKVSGTWELGMGWADNIGFTDAKQGQHTDAFTAKQRIRPQFEFIADETLRAVLALESEIRWGAVDEGGGLDADQGTFVVRRAYLDWSPVDKLSLRMGMQGIALPSATFGSPILDTNAAGVIASYQFTDNVALTAFWVRAFDKEYYGDDQTDGKNLRDELDLFGMVLPITGEGFSVTPWVMYARNGGDSAYWNYRADDDDYVNDNGPWKGNTNLWFAGAAFELNILDPFSFKLDAMYGAAKGDDAPEYAGWLVSALFEYKSGAAWGNPGLIGWYASGDDDDDYKDGDYGKYGRMPIISNDEAGFAPAGFGFPGSMGCMDDGLITNSGVGTWGVGLQLDEISFMDKLSHTLRAVYVRGTNDADIIKKSGASRDDVPFAIMGESVYLTDKDWAFEVDFVSAYEFSENLTIYLETNWVKLDLDSNTWGSKDSKTTDAWKAQLLFEYSF